MQDGYRLLDTVLTEGYSHDGAASIIAAALCDARRQGQREVSKPCRHCDSANMLDGLHIYGERKCCPDCDHRADEAL